MNTIKTFVKKHAVLIYFALTFAISWGGIMTVIGPAGILGTSEIPEELMPFLYLSTLLGPSIAGIVMPILVDGKAGFRSLLSRLGKWGVNARWYAVALLTAPVLISTVLLVLSRISPAFLPAILTADNKVSLVLTGVVMGLMVGFCEELGWTGFAVPRLRQRYGILKTGIIVGVVWGAWHFPLFVGSIASSGTIPPALYLATLLFSFLPAYRVLMVWVYDRTKSLPIAALMHAPLSGSQLVLIPATIVGAQVMTYNLAFTAALWVVVGIITLAGFRAASVRKTHSI